MRQNESEPSLPQPFTLTVGQEHINDDLGSVEEISELGLPHSKIHRAVNRVAILVGHDRILGERRIEYLDTTTTWILVTEESQRIELLLCFLVNQVHVPLGESASLYILARQPDVIALIVQTEHRQSLTSSPVELVAID